jgi:K+-transporting ATPase ATPase C chain
VNHLRANLWLLLLTLLLCAVLYPLALLGVGQAFFPAQAEGSLLRDKQGKVIGSRLIAQPFTDSAPEYFQPRPSSASYKGDVSGASNYGANNPALRARVAQALGPIVKYQGPSPTGNSAQKDIELWFQQWSKNHPKEKVGVVAKWAELYSTAATNWVKADRANGDYVAAWQKDHPGVVAAYVNKHPDNTQPKPEDMAQEFFASYSEEHPGTWPSYAAPAGKPQKVWQHVKDGSDIHSFFFDMWLQEHPDAKLEQVPADLVTASGSGLDPHITLENARYQLRIRVLDAQVERALKALPDRESGAARRAEIEKKVQALIEEVLEARQEAPLGGLVGVPLVNVLEVNLAVRDGMEKLIASLR